MSSTQKSASQSLIPLYINIVIACSIGVIYLFAGSESALLLLFMLGLIFVYGLIFCACTLILGRAAVSTRNPALVMVVAASASYIAIWLYAALSGELSHNSTVYTAAFISSFLYSALALVLARRI